jgi:hypothetical protein
MNMIITFIIFTAAFAAAAEYAWWGPRRRLRLEIDQRLRGLLVESGRRPGSPLASAAIERGSFIARLEVMKRA